MRACCGSGEKTGILQVFMADSGQTKSRENHNMFFESPYTGEQIESTRWGEATNKMVVKEYSTANVVAETVRAQDHKDATAAHLD
jgi:hypothetical protein